MIYDETIRSSISFYKKKNANRFVDFSEAQIWRSPHSLDEEVHHTLNKGYTWQP